MKGWRVAVLILAVACGSESTIDQFLNDDPPGTPPIPVIVDYSPTVSDVGGLMFLLAHPRVDVLAVTMSETGEAGCELGLDVTLRILAMLGRNEIPVACDPTIPDDARRWPAAFLDGHEKLLDGLPPANARPSSGLAADLIARVAADSNRPVTIYAVEPLTVIAKALSNHKDLADDIERIVVMGGAVDVPGNVFDSNAEWNLYIDTRAAASVIGSGVPVTLVPLDATNDVPVPNRYREKVSDRPASQSIAYLSGLIERFPSVTSGFYYLWDELAASVAAGERFTSFEEINLVVVVGGPDDGQTLRGEGILVTVATGVRNADLFYEHFLETLARSG